MNISGNGSTIGGHRFDEGAVVSLPGVVSHTRLVESRAGLDWMVEVIELHTTGHWGFVPDSIRRANERNASDAQILAGKEIVGAHWVPTEFVRNPDGAMIYLVTRAMPHPLSADRKVVVTFVLTVADIDLL